ncbi:MAG: hypothetical protein HY923_01465 [Elusimicrobia bacterium]|nr:hypothetical protein [Elusimicrobiota bacterium]
MMTPVLAVLLAAPGRAVTPFVEQLRKAETRSASDQERVEFATRAIRAWLPADGRPLLAHAHFARAEGEMELSDDPHAEEDLSKTLEIDPANEAARLMRSRARASLGRGAEAERDARDYLSARPDDAEARLALGEALLLQGQPKAGADARQAFAGAADVLGKDDPRPSLGEGRSWLSARRHADALVALNAAAEHPQKLRPEILSERSRAYSALGNWRAAREDLGEAIPGLERRVEEKLRAGAVKRGRDAARKNLADAYFRRGLAGEALGDRDGALADHKQACGLGLAAACARADSLEKPQPKPAPAPKPVKPKRKKNPKGDSGDRIYAH